LTPQDLRTRHPEHFAKAAALRVLAMDAVQAANSGHPGMPMGMADIATVLFEKHLKFDPKAPEWPDRDRFVLSNGHGSMLLYALLHLTGYEDMTLEELKNFRQLGSKTAGHPEYGHARGIETTTGPLGQGLATAVGMAMAEAALAARFSARVVDHHTYVFAGDGCLMEGISHEAIGLAGKHQLSKLIVLWDDNKISIDGDVSKSDITDQQTRFRASGWDVFECDGHDPAAIDAAILSAKASAKPSLIACRTHIGYGAPNKQDTAWAHGSPLGAEEIAAVREIYGWSHDPFVIPQDVRDAWAAIGAQGASARAAWEDRLEALGKRRREQFERIMSGDVPKTLTNLIRKFKSEQAEAAPKVATRKASEMILEVVNKALPETMGGSADLTGSNNTLTKDLGTFEPSNRSGRYVYYGIREHGMAAAMNGMALHGGVIPYGGTFLVFSDYARGAMRISSLIGKRVIYVLTHDSIGLGEDGPTHQPVEHLMSLRAMPNLLVFRPADAVETAECWQLALESRTTPSVIALTRQTLEPARLKAEAGNPCARGGYILREARAGKPDVVLLATGSEVEIILAARSRLETEGVATRVVSLPCFELFDAQDPSYRAEVLGGDGVLRVSIEAGVTFGWARYVGEAGISIGLDRFGLSAPYKDVYQALGLSVDAVVDAVKARL